MVRLARLRAINDCEYPDFQAGGIPLAEAAGLMCLPEHVSDVFLNCMQSREQEREQAETREAQESRLVR